MVDGGENNQQNYMNEHGFEREQPLVQDNQGSSLYRLPPPANLSSGHDIARNNRNYDVLLGGRGNVN